jgi:hypothetical protein
MPYYQAQGGKVYFLDDSVTTPADYLPAGSMMITDDQAKILLGVPSPLQEARIKRIYGSYAISGKIPGLVDDYASAISQPVSFTTAGSVTKYFQSDAKSVANLQAAIAGCAGAQSTPVGFYWVSADNTRVPFVYADLQGLASAIFDQGVVAFQNLQDKKSAVNAATTEAAVSAVVW